MRRVIGLGGIFFKSSNPEALREWYNKHLGIDASQWGAMMFWKEAQPDESPYTLWCPFPETSRKFAPSEKQFMFNFRVENLDALLELLRAEGVEILDGKEEGDYGKFAWILDLEGNKIELWEPPQG